MSSRCRNALLLGAIALGAAACDREDRDFRSVPPGNSPTNVVRQSPLQPGPMVMTSHAENEYGENAYAVSQGQRLFTWFNCAGCHANGGGGMGPALMDDQWIYGSAPEQIYATIMEGRPNGMPSWAGRINDSQAWQIVAYVRSLSGLTSPNVRSARTDDMMSYPGSRSLEAPERPVQSTVPPAAQQP